MTTTEAKPYWVRAGNHTKKWLVRGEDVPIELCTCRQSVFEYGDMTTPLLGGPIAVTETLEHGGETYFAVALTPEQTAALNTDPGCTRRFMWFAEVIGGVEVLDPYNYELCRELEVESQAMPAV